MKLQWVTPLIAALLLLRPAAAQPRVLSADAFRHYVERFNREDEELYRQYIPNAAAWAFLEKNIPFLDCPDEDLQETYYFRWWTYRKHVRKTPGGFVITEFLPSVPWAGLYNTISCAAGHHFYEGRWLHDPVYLNDYMRFWMESAGQDTRKYSFWSADAWQAFGQVHPRAQQRGQWLDSLAANYRAWERTHREDIHHLFWQLDGADGMEVSAGGQCANDGKAVPGYRGIRPTINSYMYGDALALATLAQRAGRPAMADSFRARAAALRRGVQRWLWSDSLQFFGSIALDRNSTHPAVLPVRELIGFVPWYFNLPADEPRYAAAWRQLMDTAGFFAPYGPTTCERRHPYFALSYQDHECQWNGPSWPYATSQTLTAMANLLDNYRHAGVTRADYYRLLMVYARSQRRRLPDGRVLPWIDENLNPLTGDWISRTRLARWPEGPWPAGKGGRERGKDYNHSSFCDLVITGLIGIRPRWDDSLELRPLLPQGQWDYFCLDNVRYHGRIITVLYDQTGRRYRRGRGFRILVDGREAYAGPRPAAVTLSLSGQVIADRPKTNL